MGGQESKKEKVFQTHLGSWPHVPPGGDGDAHEGFVAQQLPVELLEVPELPFHVPYELPVGQLDGVHIEAWDLAGGQHRSALLQPLEEHLLCSKEHLVLKQMGNPPS